MALPVNGDRYFLINTASTTAMDIANFDGNSFTVVGDRWKIAPGINGQDQLWTIQYTEVANNGRQYMKLINIAAGGACLDLKTLPATNGDAILAQRQDQLVSPEWFFKDMGDNGIGIQTYQLCNRAAYDSVSNTDTSCINLVGGGTSEGTPVQNTQMSGLLSQVWATIGPVGTS